MSDAANRLAALRDQIKAQGLDGFLVPREDEFQGEFIPASAERLAWLTGFTGSAGMAIVLADKAALFIDSRYTIQAREQVPGDLYEHVDVMEMPPSKWLGANAKKDMRIGYDARLHTVTAMKAYRAAAKKAECVLVPTDGNLIDAIWSDRPADPITPTVPHPAEYAGEDAGSKRTRLGKDIANKDADAALLAAPESIAWLLNIRGTDVSHTPLPLSYALLSKDGHVDLFLDPGKASAELDQHLGNEVTRHDISAIGDRLAQLKDQAVLIDPAVTADGFREQLESAGAKIIIGNDPCSLPKACKNQTERAGTRAAHLRDGAALTRFLHFMATQAHKETLTELSAAQALYDFRAELDGLKDLSFDTISATGPNGALPHYRVTEESNRPIKKGDLYLVDSGGQYLDGTTDVTRTISIGDVAATEKDRFTRVLKGMVSLSLQRFPKGTTGAQLDVLARSALWNAGLNFGHGTGHGVGVYLRVHEGPQGISPRANATDLRPGMIVSNEPGYYLEGAFGIRIENLVMVTDPEEIGGDDPMLGFETLTFAPIDRDLIIADMLNDAERDWLNAYHAQVRDVIGSQIKDADCLNWLDQVTQPV